MTVPTRPVAHALARAAAVETLWVSGFPGSARSGTATLATSVAATSLTEHLLTCWARRKRVSAVTSFAPHGTNLPDFTGLKSQDLNSGLTLETTPFIFFKALYDS